MLRQLRSLGAPVLGAVHLLLPRGLYRSQLRECLAKQRELQKWKNQQLEARIANETDLARAEERFAARQHEHERVMASRATEYARHREQWKADRDRERQDHAQEVADLTKLHVSTDSGLCTHCCHHFNDVTSGSNSRPASWHCMEPMRDDVSLCRLSSVRRR